MAWRLILRERRGRWLIKLRSVLDRKFNRIEGGCIRRRSDATGGRASPGSPGRYVGSARISARDTQCVDGEMLTRSHRTRYLNL